MGWGATARGSRGCFYLLGLGIGKLGIGNIVGLLLSTNIIPKFIP